jgi:hypothetical protein
VNEQVMPSGYFRNHWGESAKVTQLQLQVRRALKNRKERFLTALAGPMGILQGCKM